MFYNWLEYVTQTKHLVKQFDANNLPTLSLCDWGRLQPDCGILPVYLIGIIQYCIQLYARYCLLYLDIKRSQFQPATHWLHSVPRVLPAKFTRQEMSHAKGTDNYIYLVGVPILILLGTVGNCLSLALMLRKALEDNTMSLLLAALAVVDTAVLYVTMLPIWLETKFDIILGPYAWVTHTIWVSEALCQT